MVGVLGPPLLLAATLVVLVGLYAARQLCTGKKPGRADTGVIGGVLMFGLPILLSALVGFSLRSWSIAVWYALLSIVGMLLLVLLQQQAYRVHLLVELARSTTRALWRSLSLALVLLPALLVVVLLSVFSQGLWAALGGVSVLRLVCSASLLIAPALVFVLASLGHEALQITGQLPDDQTIVDTAENTAFIRSKLHEGLISEEEWQRLRGELTWRHKSKLAEDVLPAVQKRVRLWLALLFGLTSAALLTAFSVYFYVLFNVLLRPALVASWTGIPLETIPVPLGLFGYASTVHLSTTALATAKVSLLLAVFVTVMSSVYALTDESFKTRFTEWLRQKAASWLAVSCMYQCASSPNYQVWGYTVRDVEKGIANVSLVVPHGASEQQAERACEHMESRLQQYGTLIRITAFEQDVDAPVYRRGLPAYRWQLVHNKTKGMRIFEAIPLLLDELRYQHFLGMDAVAKGEDIPDEWFGNSPLGIALAKTIWEEDDNQEWVLHPYMFESDVVLSVEVCLLKRRRKSSDYRRSVGELLALIREKAGPGQDVWIDLSFRDTVETLARLHWTAEIPYVEYKDEIDGKTRLEKPSNWI